MPTAAPVPSLGGGPHALPARAAPTAGRTAARAGRAEARGVLHRAARVLLGRLPELTDRVALAIQRQEPAYRPPAADPERLWREVHCSLRHGVTSLLRPGETREAARSCTRRIAATRAASGLPLDALLHAFRIGGGVVWDDLLETAGRLDPEGMRLLVHVTTDVWNFVDEHCSLAADAYRRTERRLAWRRTNRRRLMLRALLEGTSRVADLPEIAATLGLSEEGRYAVAVVRPTPGATAPAVDWAASRVTPPPGLRLLWLDDPAAAPRAGRPAPEPGVGETALVVFDGDDGDGGAHGDAHGGPRPDRPEDAGEPPDPADVRRVGHEGHGTPGDHALLAALAHALTPPPGRRVGISSVVDRLAAVGEARRLAETALRAGGADGRAVLLDDHLPAALLVSSPELGAALAERVLGPVLRLRSGDSGLLLDTLAAWLACDGSAQRAADRLRCHRNTVLNRLRRYERLTGHSLSSPQRLVELSLALTARRLRTG